MCCTPSMSASIKVLDFENCAVVNKLEESAWPIAV